MTKTKLTATVVLNESGDCFLVGADVLELDPELNSEAGVFHCDEATGQVHFLPFNEHPNVVRSQN